ncbi:hypothetical protein NC651_025987 [Populus alba x Populus x berolinensis]|nr:hypothetical protein NC651_025987 [Populus alba x Populus x berolinensis]
MTGHFSVVLVSNVALSDDSSCCIIQFYVIINILAKFCSGSLKIVSSFVSLKLPILSFLFLSSLPLSLLLLYHQRHSLLTVNNYDFRYSLVDIPLVSIIRSVVIICVYSLCDGPRLSTGPYLGITTICSVSSLIYVSFKAPRVFRVSSTGRGEYVRAMEIALFFCSLLLAIGHVVVAYRTSCRERRKLWVYKIDIEAVSACKNVVFPRFIQQICSLETVEETPLTWRLGTSKA